MKIQPPEISRGDRAFTLIELIMVIAIIAMLVSMLMPAYANVRKRADSLACANNLRQLGVSVNLYLGEHNYTYPYVQIFDRGAPQFTTPEYDGALSLLDTFSPYGLTDKVLQCPADIKDPNANTYAEYGTSYLWSPVLDDESQTNPIIYGRRWAFQAPLSRVKLAMDGYPVHNNRVNRLYADGHVVNY